MFVEKRTWWGKGYVYSRQMTSVSAVLFPRARTHACVCVWMIQQLVQLQSVTAARPLQHKRSSDKNKQKTFILIFPADSEQTRAGDACVSETP